MSNPILALAALRLVHEQHNLLDVPLLLDLLEGIVKPSIVSDTIILSGKTNKLLTTRVVNTAPLVIETPQTSEQKADDNEILHEILHEDLPAQDAHDAESADHAVGRPERQSLDAENSEQAEDTDSEQSSEQAVSPSEQVADGSPDDGSTDGDVAVQPAEQDEKQEAVLSTTAPKAELPLDTRNAPGVDEAAI